MNMHNTAVQSASAQLSSFRYFGELDRVEVYDLNGASRLELFAVVAEHWTKCSAAAQNVLISHPDAFIRCQAMAQLKAFSEPDCCVRCPRNK